MAPLDDVQVGDLVNVPGGMFGTVKYLGSVAGKPGKFAGIELAPEHARRGKNNGDVEGRRYFSTSVPGSGIFVPMNNNKYVTKRSSGPTSTVSTGPPTPSRPVNFSKSVGPGPAMRPPRVRRPSLPRPESPRGPPPSKLTLTGLRTPSSASRAAPSSTYPRSPIKAPSRASDRPPSRVSRVSTEDDGPASRVSEVQQSAMAAEVQELKDHIKSLENQLLDRDKQLDEQAHTLSDFQRTLEELEGSDSLSIRAQLRERNERIAQLTAEFDLHRADFRSTLDTLEIAASETERVYEQRLDELMQQNRELQDRGEDVEAVARQLKQLEELVSELEEGLEDARRGEAEARAEVEFLRGEVERTKLELQKERDSKDSHAASDGPQYSKELEQKDDEIRGLKAIIHSLSRGDPDLHALQQNGFGTSPPNHDPDHVAHLEQRVEEFERIAERKTYRIEELERELQQLQLNGETHAPGSAVSSSPNHQKSPSVNGKLTNGHVINHAHRLSDRTVVPHDWQDLPPHEGQYQAYSTRHRGVSDASHHRLETMHESDGRSEDGGSLWCEICETGGHDILTCTNMFGAESKKVPDAAEAPHDDSSVDEKPTPEESTGEPSTSSHEEDATPQKTGRDVVMEGLREANLSASSSTLGPVGGKESGVVDESKWCALCERDGHESIDCPFDD